MQVNARFKSSEQWRTLWPAGLLLLLIALAGSLLWIYWPSLIRYSALWQKALNQHLSQLLQQVAENPDVAGLTLLVSSLLYGILHAAGPGHGKVIITTFLATHPTKLKNSLQLTFAAALLQGAVAILLVSGLMGLWQLTSRQMHLSSYWLEKGSYLLTGVLGVWLCWRALNRLRQLIRPANAGKPFTITAVHHTHDHHCGCGHQHIPRPEMVAMPGIKTRLLVVLSMGIRPCSGAIMMLLFAKVTGVWLWGVLSAMVMAIGTALTISAIALLVHHSRALAERLSLASTTTTRRQLTVHCLAMLGGVLLMIAAVVLWSGVQPAVSGGLRGVM